MNDLSRRSDGDGPNELKILPPAWRKPVGLFCMMNSHLLPNALPVVTRLKLWMETEGLTLEIVRPVLLRLATPAALAEFQYAGQLLAALAAGVENALVLSRPPKRAADIPALANPPEPVPMFPKGRG